MGIKSVPERITDSRLDDLIDNQQEIVAHLGDIMTDDWARDYLSALRELQSLRKQYCLPVRQRRPHVAGCSCEGCQPI